MASIDIRPARPDDANALAAIYAPYVLRGTVSFEEIAPDAAAMAARMAASGGFYPWLVATAGEGGEVLGYAYAGRFRDRPAYRWVCETTIYLSDPAQGRGVGRLLYGSLVETLHAQRFTQAIGVIALPNQGSIALHEAVGFRRAGVWREVGYKQGRWIDVGLWQRQLNESHSPPADPRPFDEVGLRRP